MSLFHSPREMRMINVRKRKKGHYLCDEEDFIKNETFKCDICSEGYESETEVYLHRRSKHKNVIKKMLFDELVCKICVKKQESYDDLLKHVKSQHLLSSEEADYVEREIFICDTCNLLYFNKRMLSVHMQYSHDQKNKHKLKTDCPKCDRMIQVKHIWFHFQRHLIQSIVCCPICLKKCKNHQELKEHIKEHPYFYHCNMCDYDTKTRDMFVSHTPMHASEGTSINEELLTRCFVPNTVGRRSNFNFGIRGINLHDLKICILCRAICTDEDTVDHIMKYHTVDKKMETETRKHTCLCGESFFNNVLLKHHVFKLQGDHKPCL